MRNTKATDEWITHYLKIRGSEWETSWGRTIAHCTGTQGYYWPIMQNDICRDASQRYFSKWVDAQAYSSIKDKDAMNSCGKILCQFGIPWAIISNNGPQFDTSTYRNFYKGLGIKEFLFHPSILSSVMGKLKPSTKHY
ncbi:hypothetical protein CK203_034371 [Vitis vinifera]|uniref:Integrase catalytic domain-containing protein n=1 Tax=Vitis vinifera TaxID=29760 RepID=A0A438INI3_VITVI|nr:hypothetical protein CK203_034371 [Vitis vinifera]